MRILSFKSAFSRNNHRTRRRRKNISFWNNIKLFQSFKNTFFLIGTWFPRKSKSYSEEIIFDWSFFVAGWKKFFFLFCIRRNLSDKLKFSSVLPSISFGNIFYYFSASKKKKMKIRGSSLDNLWQERRKNKKN